MDTIIVSVDILSVDNGDSSICFNWDDYRTDQVEQSIVAMDFSDELLDDITQDRGLTLTVIELRRLQSGITEMLNKIDATVKK